LREAEEAWDFEKDEEGEEDEEVEDEESKCRRPNAVDEKLKRREVNVLLFGAFDAGDDEDAGARAALDGARMRSSVAVAAAVEMEEGRGVLEEEGGGEVDTTDPLLTKGPLGCGEGEAGEAGRGSANLTSDPALPTRFHKARPASELASEVDSKLDPEVAPEVEAAWDEVGKTEGEAVRRADGSTL